MTKKEEKRCNFGVVAAASGVLRRRVNYFSLCVGSGLMVFPQDVVQTLPFHS